MSRSGVHAIEATPGSLGTWASGLAAALDGSGPAMLPLPAGPHIVRKALVDAFRPDDPSAPADVEGLALVVPTSGSTGVPKGALLSASAIRASAGATAARLSGPGHWVLALPLTHVAGLMVLARAQLAGSVPVSAIGVDGGPFDPDTFGTATRTAAAQAERAGQPLYTSLVPTQLDRLLTAGTDLRAYAAILVGAAATPAQLLDRARGAGVGIVTTYGMTETCGGCVYDGSPLEAVTVDVEHLDDSRARSGPARDLGRVLLGGPTIFSGYRLRPDLTAATLDGDGRLRTNDLGRRLEGGLLQVVGRIDDVIVSGGEKIVPGEVERVLSQLSRRGDLPGVFAWCVVGVPDPQWGERVVAVAEGGSDVGIGAVERIRTLTATQLPPAWRPRDLLQVLSMPLLATGKVDRAAVRDLAVRAMAR